MQLLLYQLCWKGECNMFMSAVAMSSLQQVWSRHAAPLKLIVKSLLATVCCGCLPVAVALAVCPTYTAELFPTCVRSTAMGIFNQAARGGSIAAPFLLMLGAQLNLHSQPIFLPFMLFGLLSVVAGLMVLVLPETLGTTLPESMQV
jgi:OCT family organic cation transporter-like MFS transporter 4/5